MSEVLISTSSNAVALYFKTIVAEAPSSGDDDWILVILFEAELFPEGSVPRVFGAPDD